MSDDRILDFTHIISLLSDLIQGRIVYEILACKTEDTDYADALDNRYVELRLHNIRSMITDNYNPSS